MNEFVLKSVHIRFFKLFISHFQGKSMAKGTADMYRKYLIDDCYFFPMTAAEGQVSYC